MYANRLQTLSSCDIFRVQSFENKVNIFLISGIPCVHLLIVPVSLSSVRASYCRPLVSRQWPSSQDRLLFGLLLFSSEQRSLPERSSHASRSHVTPLTG